uniref:Helicase-associated domain-containing protein n=1 Tax=Pyramimonas obovata TaxID=1411642 RepID=A0A7S0WF35_9CHLO|mmetsp:Transcript_23880/g.52163  ORF Transcript_23880/g.52163 Transcript_23880/m.52163 type:complete len:234 (+) Transcript_23880:105-806(+)
MPTTVLITTQCVGSASIARISASFGASCARSLHSSRRNEIAGRSLVLNGAHRRERTLVAKISASGHGHHAPHAEKVPHVKKSGLKKNSHTPGAHVTSEEEKLLRMMPLSGWKQNYLQLHAFSEENGHCSPLDENSRDLGAWVKEQRHNRHENTLDHAQVVLLDSLRFDWESGAAEWMQNALRVKALCVGERCSVSRKEDPELGQWLSEQRAAHRHNRLSKARTATLMDFHIIH